MFTTTHLYGTDPQARHPSGRVHDDQVRAISVVLFVDQLIVTLRHYAETGRLHNRGLSTGDAKDFIFASTPERGYPRYLVENLQTYAYFALQAFERGNISEAIDQFEDVACTITELAMSGTEMPSMHRLQGF